MAILVMRCVLLVKLVSGYWVQKKAAGERRPLGLATGVSV
jgi:uncharacterized protein YneF (UPF0154 family)